MKVLGKRFVERDSTDERHQANKMFNLVENYDLYAELFKEYGEFNTGDQIIPVDATSFEKIDFTGLIQIASIELGRIKN